MTTSNDGEMVMGKSRIVPYVIKYTDQFGVHTAHWEERTRAPYFGQGKPDNTKAEAWRIMMNKSFQKDGCNSHISNSRGIIPHISHVRIYSQKTGKDVAYAMMPMFEAV